MAAPPTLNRVTVSEAILAYRRSLERRVLGGQLSANTQATYERDLADFERLVGGPTVLDDLSAENIDDVVVAYSSEPDRRFKDPGRGGRGPSVVARFRQSVAGLFGYAERQGYLQRNPMQDTEVRPKIQKGSGARHALSLETAHALIELPAADEESGLAMRNALIFRVLLETGVRVSELCALDRADVGLVDGHVLVRIRHGKGNKARDVFLTLQTYELLGDWQTNHRPAPWEKDSPDKRADADRALLVTNRGRRMTPRTVQDICQATAKRLPHDLARQFHPHTLRHSMATLALSNGTADVVILQRLLGHESLATTGKYTDLIKEDLIRAVQMNPVTGSR